VIRNQAIEGEMTKEEAVELLRKTTRLVKLLTASFRRPPLEPVYNEFFGGQVPVRPKADEYLGHAFSVPAELVRVADAGEIREYADLFWNLPLRIFRYGLSQPAYAAAPEDTIEAADGQTYATWRALSQEKRFEHIDEQLEQMDSQVSSLSGAEFRRVFAERLALFREFDDAVDDELAKSADLEAFEANRELLKIPLALGAVGSDESNEHLYEVVFAPYIEIRWKKQKNGFMLSDINIPTP
jgi:hypothetical protein